MSLGECQSELEVVRQELAEMRDKYLRVAATTDNTRKQAERNAAVRANERVRSFSLHLLEVVDNLERALQHASPDDALRPGVEATRQQLLATLRQEGVVPLPTQPGAAFDPHQHEAIAGHAADVAHDTVVDVAQNGYTFEGQVLRPARVIVATPPRTDGAATG
jgi:molecular chaperone GrpE